MVNRTARGASDLLIARYRHLPAATASRFRSVLPVGLDLNDLVGAGNLGLCKAARDFDPSRGASFTTYAITLIRGAILEHIRSWDFCPRSVRDKQRRGEAPAAPPPISLEDSVGTAAGTATRYADILQDESEGPETLALRNAERQAVGAAVSRLPEREREIVMRYYGKGHTFARIAAEFGLSESRVFQLHAQAIQRLRNQGGLQALFQA